MEGPGPHSRLELTFHDGDVNSSPAGPGDTAQSWAWVMEDPALWLGLSHSVKEKNNSELHRQM